MIKIRKFELSDLYTTHEYLSDHQNTYYMLNNPSSSIEDTKQSIERIINEYQKEKPDFLSFVVEHNKLHIGEVFSTLIDDYAIIGYIINKKCWGNGFGYLAAKWMVEYLKNYDVNYIIGYCDSRNVASKKILEKLGMEYIGTNGVRSYSKDVTTGIELKYILVLN